MESIQLCDGLNCTNEPDYTANLDHGVFELCDGCAETYDDELEPYQE